MWGEPIGWHQHALKGCFLFFEEVGGWILIKFRLFPSITHQNLFVLNKFPINSYQIPLVPINYPSKSFRSYLVPIKFLLFQPSFYWSHQVPIKFLLFRPSFCWSHQFPFVLIKFPSSSFLFPTQPYINPHKALNFGINSFFATWKIGSWEVPWWDRWKKCD